MSTADMDVEAPVHLTEEEEAILLSQYGSRDPLFDEVLQLGAPSRHTDKSNGGHSLFLTGVTSSDACKLQPDSRSARLEPIDFVAPVELFVLRQLNVTSSSCPLAMADAVIQTIGYMKHHHEAALASDPMLDRLHELEATTESSLLGIKPALHHHYHNNNASEDEEVDRELANLLEEAEKEIQRKNFHYDPATDPVFQERLRALRETETTPLDDDAFEDDAQLLSVAEWEAVKAEASKRVEDEDEARRRREVPEAVAGPVLLPQQPRDGMNADPTHSELPHSSEVKPLALALNMPNILDHIRSMDERDAALELRLVSSRDAAAQLRVPLELHSAESRRLTDASSRGVLALLDFSRKFDSLLAPPLSFTAEAGTSDTHAEPSSASSAAMRTSDARRQAAARTKKAAQRQDFLLLLQTRESRRMREEDDRMCALLRQEEIRRIESEDRRNALVSSEGDGRRAVLGEEAVSHAEILIREDRQRAALVNLMVQIAAEKRSQLLSELQEQYHSVRFRLVELEICEWNEMATSASNEKQVIAAEAQAMERRLLLREKEIRDQYTEARSARWVALLHSAHASSVSVWQRALRNDCYGSCSTFPSHTERSAFERTVSTLGSVSFRGRLEEVLLMVSRKQQWVNDTRSLTTAVLQAISVALHSAVPQRDRGLRKRRSSNAALKRSSPTPRALELSSAAPPVPEETPLPPVALHGVALEPESTGSVCLNSALVKRLHSPLFAAATAEPHLAPQIFHSLSFSLEKISTIDHAALREMCACRVSATRTALSDTHALVKVAPFVKYLDLSSNLLTIVDMDALFYTFPSLVTLTVAHNRIAKIATRPEGNDDATTPAASNALQSLDLSDNALVSTEGIERFSELRRAAMFANQIVALDGLSRCTKLRELELSRNSIADLLQIASLPTLGTLDVSRNAVSSMDCLSTSAVLEKLFLSHNKIREFPRSLPLVFLRQLFLSDNQLTSVPEGLSWLPLLQDLHLESNSIATISGVRGCQQLCRINLSFNQIQNVDDLEPLYSLKRLTSVAINDNPVFQTPFNVREAERYLVASLPRLAEYNSEVLSGDRVRELRASFMRCEAVFPTSLVLHYRQGKPASPTATLRWFGYWLSSFCELRTDADVNSCSTSPVVSTAVGSGLDALLNRLQTESDASHIFSNRKLQSALAAEQHFSTRSKERGGYVLPALIMQSDVILERRYVESLQQTQRHLEALRDTATLDSSCNVHSVSVAYKLRAAAHREAQSKKRISEWILGRVLIAKAKRELHVLREASEIGRLRRLTKAALTIQPLWRGAIVRKRLQAAKLDDSDDDVLFQKVSFDQPDRPVGFSNFSSLLQSAFVSNPQAPQFQVNADLPGTRLGSAPGKHVGAPPALGRPHSNGGGSVAVGDASPGAPDPQEQHAQSARQSSTLDDEWGADVADQLRRMQKKREKAKQDQIRKDFMNDPLRAKKLLKK